MIPFIARGREIIKVKLTKDFSSNWPYGLERKVSLFSFVFQSRCARSEDFWLQRQFCHSLGDSNYNYYTMSCAILVHAQVGKLSTGTISLSWLPLVTFSCQQAALKRHVHEIHDFNVPIFDLHSNAPKVALLNAFLCTAFIHIWKLFIMNSSFKCQRYSTYPKTAIIPNRHIFSFDPYGSL